MRKTTISFLGFLIGLVSFLFVPYGFKFIGFIVPLIMLSVVLSSKEDYFNINLFLVFLFIFLMIPSSFMTFDANNPINFTKLINGSVDIIDSIALILFIGVPVFMIVGAVYAFIIGKTDTAVKNISRLILIIGIMILFFFLLDFANIKLFGFTRFVLDFYSDLLEIIIELPATVYNGAKDMINIVSVGTISLPKLPSYEGKLKRASFDTYSTRFSTMDYTTVIFSIHDSLPLLISLFCLLIGIITIRKKWEKNLVIFMDKVSIKQEKKTRERTYFPNVNYKMLIYMTILMISAFAIALSYTNSFGADIRTDYQYILFFSIYMIMTTVSILALNLTGFTYYKDSNFYNTIKGTVYGLFGLLIMTRLFFTYQVMSAMSTQTLSTDVIYIINTFVFIAPAESIFFHVFIPALVAGVLLSYSKRNIKRGYQIGVQEELSDINTKIYALEQIQVYVLKHGTKKELANIQIEMNDLKQQQLIIQKQEIERVFVSEKTLYGRSTTLVLFFLFGVILPNFIFATMHSIVPQIDFFLFWTSGLAMVYLAGGVWFCFISLRYGWFAGIMTHALYNTNTIILAIIFFGG